MPAHFHDVQTAASPGKNGEETNNPPAQRIGVEAIPQHLPPVPPPNADLSSAAWWKSTEDQKEGCENYCLKDSILVSLGDGWFREPDLTGSTKQPRGVPAVSFRNEMSDIHSFFVEREGEKEASKVRYE